MSLCPFVLMYFVQMSLYPNIRMSNRPHGKSCQPCSNSVAAPKSEIPSNSVAADNAAWPNS